MGARQTWLKAAGNYASITVTVSYINKVNGSWKTNGKLGGLANFKDLDVKRGWDIERRTF